MALDAQGNVIPAFRPDNPDMYGGGRLTNFTATIGAAYIAALRGKENPKHFVYGCFDLTDIVTDQGNEHDDYTKRYFLGYLTSKFGAGVFPSVDGVEPVGGTREEYAALADGSMQIEPGTEDSWKGTLTVGDHVRPDCEWSQVLLSIMHAPVDGQESEWQGWGANVSCLTGLRCVFDLVEPINKKAKKREDGSTNDVLVVTRIVSTPAPSAAAPKAAASKAAPKAASKAAAPATAAKAAAPAPTPTATATAATNGNSEIDEELANEIFPALAAADNQTLSIHPDLTGIAMKKFAGRTRAMQMAVPRVAQPAFHEGRPWTYDAAKRVITLAAE